MYISKWYLKYLSADVKKHIVLCLLITICPNILSPQTNSLHRVYG